MLNICIFTYTHEHTHTHTHTHILSLSLSLSLSHTHAHTYIHTRTHPHIYPRTHTHTHTRTHTHARTQYTDEMLLSLMRRVLVPDTDFIFNLGDWPLGNGTQQVSYTTQYLMHVRAYVRTSASSIMEIGFLATALSRCHIHYVECTYVRMCACMYVLNFDLNNGLLGNGTQHHMYTNIHTNPMLYVRTCVHAYVRTSFSAIGLLATALCRCYIQQNAQRTYVTA